MQLLTSRLVVAILTYMAPSHVWADEPLTPEDFLAAYKSASHAFRDFYSQIQLTEIQTGPYIARLTDRGILRFAYYGRSPSIFRIDTVGDQGAVHRSVVFTPQRLFRVEAQQEGRYALTDFQPRPKAVARDRILVISAKLPFVAYCLIDRPILELLESEEFRVTDVASKSRDSGTTILVTLEGKPNPGGAIPQAVLEFDPSMAWVVTSVEFGGKLRKHGDGLFCSISYRNTGGKIPIPEKAVYWQINDGKRYDLYIAELQHYELKPAHEGMFAMSAFGLPELEGIQSPANAWLWLLSIGVFLFVLGLSFGLIRRYLLRR